MFSPLKEAFYFARHHARPLLIIALALSLPGWLLEYSLPAPTSPEDGPGASVLLAWVILTCLGVIQFAAAMIYIHQQVQQQPVSALRAITLAGQRLGPLFLLNMLMAVGVLGGLMLLILPGLFLAYKLMFGEFYLLFHGQKPLQALKSSYSENTALADKLLPPLLMWGGMMVTAALIHHNLQDPEQFDVISGAVFELINIALNLLGWALLYRLYQLYIAPEAPLPPTAAVPVEPTETDSLERDDSPERINSPERDNNPGHDDSLERDNSPGHDDSPERNNGPEPDNASDRDNTPDPANDKDQNRP